MGENRKFIEGLIQTPSAISRSIGFADYNTMTRNFMREISLRSQANASPNCLLLDIEEGGQTLWARTSLGDASRQLTRDACKCFDDNNCRQPISSGGSPPTCNMFLPITPQRNKNTALASMPPEKADDTADDGPSFELVMSCHSISFVSYNHAVCFLNRLRGYVSAGGMLFISALGKYSALADHYENAEEPLLTRYFPLGNSAPLGIAKSTRVCLYSERDLCNTLFESGWSVVRSSTTTENNVLATAIRV